jgi:hypothetical protein
MIGYSLSDLLVGRAYISRSDRSRSGIIKEAIRRDDILDADYAYSVRVRKQDTLEDFWATVWVAIEE